MSGSWSICPACGGVVADVTAHGAWHAVLAARLAAADGVTSGAWAGGPVPTVPAPTDVEQAQADADRAALDAITATAGTWRVDGEPWTRPAHALEAFRLGAIVTRDGKTWESLIDFNFTTPGDPTDPQAYRWWKDITPAPEPPPGPQPWDGNGVRYLVGDEVTYLGVTYRIRQVHTSQPTWTPNIIPALYLPI